MRLAAIMLALALTVAVPRPAHAQINPAQAVGIAESIAGIVFGTMYPTPRCGPHDAPPRPYQPATPHYAPPPRPDQPPSLDDDDDDEPIQPLRPRRLSTYSLQPQINRDADDGVDQTINVRTRDAGRRPVDEPALSDDAAQPVQTHVPRRRARRNPPPQTIGQTQSSGQVAEIPSQPRVATQASEGGQ